jgi:hypothetical protein
MQASDLAQGASSPKPTAYERRADVIHAARVGVAMALIGPALLFSLKWFLHGGTKGGLIEAICSSLIYGTLIPYG